MRLRHFRTGVSLALILAFHPALAQSEDGAINCDANLNPSPETEKQREERIACETHAGCILVAAIVRTSCRAAEFFRKLSERDDPSRPITNEDVADAATPDYPASPLADEYVSAAKHAARQSPNLKTVAEELQARGGATIYSETQKDPKVEIWRGTVIYPDGTIARGAFNASVNNSRILREKGQLLTPDGMMQVGSFNGSYGDNRLHTNTKSAITFRESNGTTSILEGTFCQSRPCDGEMVRRFSDGTSQRELWYAGQLTAKGDLSAPGGVPPRLSQDTFPLPSYSPIHLEGFYLDRAGPDKERILLWCNRELVAVGETAPKGKAKPPLPKECPRPETYRNGQITVVGPGLSRRYEYWCRGKMIGATEWRSGPPWRSLSPAPRCEDTKPAVAVSEDSGRGDMIERTIERSKTRPVPSTGRVLNPLIVQGPPWPCTAEIDGYIAALARRTGGRGVTSAQQYWGVFYNSPVRVMLNSGNRTVAYFHNQYLAATPSATSQPVVFTENGYPYREGFFRNERSMGALASSFEAARATEARGGDGEAGMAMNACIARYLANNARD